MFCCVVSLQSLFEQVLEIYRAVSVLLGTTFNTQYVIQHPGGTIYQSTCVFSLRFLHLLGLSPNVDIFWPDNMVNK